MECPRPDKTAYENRDAAIAALRHMHRRRKSEGLHPYHCPVGHWHLGRPDGWRRRPNGILKPALRPVEPGSVE